jgi:hypothetical protein
MTSQAPNTGIRIGMLITHYNDTSTFPTTLTTITAETTPLGGGLIVIVLCTTLDRVLGFISQPFDRLFGLVFAFLKRRSSYALVVTFGFERFIVGRSIFVGRSTYTGHQSDLSKACERWTDLVRCGEPLLAALRQGHPHPVRYELRLQSRFGPCSRFLLDQSYTLWTSMLEW